MKHQHFYLKFLTAVSVSLGLIAGLNIFIDPYGIINTPNIVGINKVKPQKNNHVRLFKAVAINRLKVKTIFLGSSRTEMGLDPNHPALVNYQPSYNLAITGGNIYEVMRYFQQSLNHQQNLEEIILGIDFLMFNDFFKNKLDFREDRLNTNKITVQDAFETIFSLDALTASIETIQFNKSQPKSTGYFYDNGMRSDKYYLEAVYQNQSKKIIFEKTISEFLSRKDLYKSYQLSAEKLNNLKTIIDACKQKGIKLKIFISPSHATDLEAIRVSGLWPVFEQWKKEVVKLAPVWDFSGYNSITTEPISKKMENYIDSSHYAKTVGDLVINRLFRYQEEKIPKDFGFLLTVDNIESYLAKVRAERIEWANKNADEVQIVEALKLKNSDLGIQNKK